MPAPLALVITLALAAPPADAPRAKAEAKDVADAGTILPDPSWKALGPSLWFDPKGRSLIVRARVVFREGPLEHLLCLKGTKEHEAILATDAAPYQIQAGLLATGARKGRPVQFVPEFIPPTGSPIAIELRWRQDGKALTSDARDWVRDERAKATLKTDWVFAGSELINVPGGDKPVFAADDGDLITVANFTSAILDLPFASTAADTDRLFVANTDRIPPRGTTVLMSFRPRPTPPAPPGP
jgi:hypothetical protein